MSMAQRIIAWVLVALVGASLVMGSVERGEKEAGVDWALLGSIPVSADGRTKPLDTFARAGLMVLSGRQSLAIDGREAPATRWALELMSNPEAGMGRRVFRVDHPDVRATLHLAGGPRDRFSFDDLAPRLGELDD